MNKDKLKDALWAMLQYGYLWGHPRYISRENWQAIRESYKELNDGKDFEPNSKEVAE